MGIKKTLAAVGLLGGVSTAAVVLVASSAALLVAFIILVIGLIIKIGSAILTFTLLVPPLSWKASFGVAALLLWLKWAYNLVLGSPKFTVLSGSESA